MTESRFPKAVYAAFAPSPKLPEPLQTLFSDLTRELYGYCLGQDFPPELREEIMALIAKAYGLTADGAGK
jgi:hypothetical protein